LINYIPSPVGRKTFGELWSTSQKVIDARVDPPNSTFSGDYISALRGADPSNFYTPYNPLKCISSRTWGAGPNFNCFCRIHPCDRRMDGRRDGRTGDSIYGL